MRDLTASVLTALADPMVRPAIFFAGEFASGTLRLWSGIGDIDWAGERWTGAGNLMSMTAIAETADSRAAGMSCSLANISVNLSLVLAEARQGKPGRVWLALMDSSGQIIGDPALAFQGRLDVPTIDEGGQGGITISYESRLIDLERARERRYTSEDQRIDYPDDLGFDFVPAIQDMTIVWGRT